MKPNRTFAEKLQSVDRRVLYTILIALTSLPLFLKIVLPNRPNGESIDAFMQLMNAPTDKLVLVESDWTISTRGENSGHLENTVRILMRRGIKFAMYSWADPQAPQVARNVVRAINEERVAAGQPVYREWEDWIDLGLVSDLESKANAMVANFQSAWNDVRVRDPEGNKRRVFESPVMSRAKSIKDVSLLINITANSSGDVLVERLGGKVKLISMCTGVVGPQLLPYAQAGVQVNGEQTFLMSGIVIGLKGVYDLEYLMEFGLNVPDAKGVVRVPSNATRQKIEPFTGMKNFDRGQNYYLTLHVALFLLILAIAVGNLGVMLGRKGGAR